MKINKMRERIKEMSLIQKISGKKTKEKHRETIINKMRA